MDSAVSCRVDYLSSYVFRLAFGQSFTEAINSEVRSAGFVSKSWSSNFLGLYMSRYQNYQSTVHGDVIDIAHISQFSDGGSRELDCWVEIHVRVRHGG